MNNTASTLPAVGAMATLLFSSATAHADTIALYTFEGGTVGEAVTTIPNAANPGTYTATAYRLGSDSLGWGEAPYWTNNVPGNCVWSDASCTQMLARAPMAVHFATNGVDTALGGCLDLANLPGPLRAGFVHGRVLLASVRVDPEWLHREHGFGKVSCLAFRGCIR